MPRNGAGEVARGGAAAAVHAGAGVFHGGLMGFLRSLMEWDLIYLMGFNWGDLVEWIGMGFTWGYMGAVGGS